MLESDPGDRELIEQMLRDAHTLKGSSRMVGLIEISDVAHRLEDIMVKVRDGQLVYTPQMSDFFFEALDTIVYLSENAGEGVPVDADLDALAARLTELASSGDTVAARAALSKSDAAAPKPGSGPRSAPLGSAEEAEVTRGGDETADTHPRKARPRPSAHPRRVRRPTYETESERART